MIFWNCIICNTEAPRDAYIVALMIQIPRFDLRMYRWLGYLILVETRRVSYLSKSELASMV